MGGADAMIGLKGAKLRPGGDPPLERKISDPQADAVDVEATI
jgi:hypothetical protein